MGDGADLGQQADFTLLVIDAEVLVTGDHAAPHRGGKGQQPDKGGFSQ